MGTNVGEINLGLDINQRSFNKQLSGIASGAQNSVMSVFKPLGKMISGALAVGSVVSFTKSCLKLGSDLSEVQNVVDVTFGSMSKKVNEFASTAIDNFGLSETVAKNMMGTYGAMSKSFGFSTEEAFNMSKAITGLTADVTSFYNLSTDEAFTKMKSIWTGETESLKSLGVVMSQTALDQYALNNGFGKTTANMTDQTKTLLRYQFVTSQLAAASGDFARTSDGWANQTRVLSLRVDALKATFGQGFINLFTPIIKMINGLLAKLSTLANAFVKFTELITGKKSQSTASNLGAIADTGSGLSNAADSAGKLGSSLEDTGKKAKKAAKEALGLSNFDKLNNLSDSKSDKGSGGGSGTGIGDMGSGLMNDISSATDEATNKMNSSLQNVIDKAKELVECFKEGFKAGAVDLDFKPIQKNISSIKDSLKDIFTDPLVLNAANNWSNTIATNMGKDVGAFTSVGVSIATLITGSLSKYFDQNKDFIKGKIVELFNISAKGSEILSNFKVAIADIFTVFKSEDAQQIGADLVGIFSNSFLNITTLVGNFAVDLIACLTNPIVENKDKIKTTIEGMFEPIRKVLDSIKGYVDFVFSSANSSYETYIKPAFDKISDGLANIVSHLLDAYNKHIEPVIDKVADRITIFIDKHLKPLTKEIFDFVGKVVDSIATIWQKTLAPFLSWVIDKLAPLIGKAIDIISKAVDTAFKAASNIISGLLKSLGGLLDFVTGVFTGDWKKAWTGIKDFFKGIIDAIKAIISPIAGFFKGIFDKAYAGVKSAFSGIKGFFSGIWTSIKGCFANVSDWFGEKFKQGWKSIKSAFSGVGEFFGGIWKTIKSKFTDIGSKIGDAVGGAFKTSINWVLKKAIGLINGFISTLNGAIKIINVIPGVKIGKIDKIPVPALAQGGYVKPNTPQLAMIGDNRHYGEVVAPEDKLQSLLNKAVSNGGTSRLETLEIMALLRDIKNLLAAIQDKDLVAYITSTELFKSLQKEAKNYKSKTGQLAFS